MYVVEFLTAKFNHTEIKLQKNEMPRMNYLKITEKETKASSTFFSYLR